MGKELLTLSKGLELMTKNIDVLDEALGKSNGIGAAVEDAGATGLALEQIVHRTKQKAQPAFEKTNATLVQLEEACVKTLERMDKYMASTLDPMSPPGPDQDDDEEDDESVRPYSPNHNWLDLFAIEGRPKHAAAHHGRKPQTE